MNLTGLEKYEFNSVIDIGAHHGNFYRELSKIKKISKWLLIEANEVCRAALPYGVPHKIAMLSDSVKTLPYYIHKDDPGCTGNSYYKEMSHYYENARVVEKTTSTLDAEVDGVYDFIKIDTQGAELDILKGGVKTVANAKYVLLETSVLPLNKDAPLQGEVIAYMNSIGYKMIEMIEETIVSHAHQQDLLFINEKNSSSNNLL